MMSSPEDIRTHMKVVGADDELVGTVDKVEGSRIKLARSDPKAGGKHHYIPTEWVESVEGEQVYLRQSAQEICRQWQSS